jgi:hypothetical protein
MRFACVWMLIVALAVVSVAGGCSRKPKRAGLSKELPGSMQFGDIEIDYDEVALEPEEETVAEIPADEPLVSDETSELAVPGFDK